MKENEKNGKYKLCSKCGINIGIYSDTEIEILCYECLKKYPISKNV